MDGLSIASEIALGRVVAASGSQVVMRLERQGGAAAGEHTLPLQLAALVKIRTRQTMVFGVVTGLSIPLPRPQPGADELELVELDLIGEIAAVTDVPLIESRPAPVAAPFSSTIST